MLWMQDMGQRHIKIYLTKIGFSQDNFDNYFLLKNASFDDDLIFSLSILKIFMYVWLSVFVSLGSNFLKNWSITKTIKYVAKVDNTTLHFLWNYKCAISINIKEPSMIGTNWFYSCFINCGRWQTVHEL